MEDLNPQTTFVVSHFIIDTLVLNVSRKLTDAITVIPLVFSLKEVS